MIYNINGVHFRNLIDFGIRSLAVYKDKVNALNVFPVPDGDTGTNMLLTLQNGFSAINNSEAALGETAKNFSRAVVFGARGNSGVIVSQFFRGLCEPFYGKETVDFCELVTALENGVQCAYKSVSRPVEGTILTVIREAIEHVRKQLDDYIIDSVNEVIGAFLEKAKISLNNTPQMLAVLKNANVVDSGGAGIIYVFEGMRSYLEGEPLPVVDYEAPSSKPQNDYSGFNKNSIFEFGYCTELLIQLTFRADSFLIKEFEKELSNLGDSIVLSQDNDKVKLHIHSHTPEKILAHCHTYGEFLTVKIENMSVQHRESFLANITVSDNESLNFSLVAVAHNPTMEKYFIDMGVDIVINASRGYQPTAMDFVSAFERSKSKNVIVFPNNKNTVLTVSQAASLSSEMNVRIIKTNTDSECYALIPTIDFESDEVDEISEMLNSAVADIDTVVITRATKDVDFDKHNVKNGDFIAMMSDKTILSCGNSLAYVVGSALKHSFSKSARDIVTVFADKSVPQNIKDAITAYIDNHSPLTEVQIIEVDDDFYNLIITLE